MVGTIYRPHVESNSGLQDHVCSLLHDHGLRRSVFSNKGLRDSNRSKILVSRLFRDAAGVAVVEELNS